MFKTELRRDPGAADPRRFRKNCSIVLVGIVTIYVYNSKKRSKRISGADFELFFFFFNCLYTYIYKYIYIPFPVLLLQRKSVEPSAVTGPRLRFELYTK